MTLMRVCCLAVALLASAPAWAHATLTKAFPAAGSTLDTAPAEVTLEFTEQLEPAFSAIQVTDGQGTPVSAGKAALVPGRKNALVLKLAALTPGTYTVTWKAVSVDTHVAKGSFTFTVAATK